MDQSISSIDDIDHELVHLFIVQPRDLRPGNGAPYGLFTKTSEQSPAAESGEMPACRSSSPEFRKHSSTISFASRCCRTGSVRIPRMGSDDSMFPHSRITFSSSKYLRRPIVVLKNSTRVAATYFSLPALAGARKQPSMPPSTPETPASLKSQTTRSYQPGL